jgi:hypothetical protein
MFEAAAFVGQRMPITLLKESPALGAPTVATAAADAAPNVAANAADTDYEEGVPPAALTFDV